MKRFVRGTRGEVIVITAATLMVAAVIGADRNGIFLIAAGFLAIAITRWRIREVLEDRSRARTGGVRNTGSR